MFKALTISNRFVGFYCSKSGNLENIVFLLKASSLLLRQKPYKRLKTFKFGEKMGHK